MNPFENYGQWYYIQMIILLSVLLSKFKSLKLYKIVIKICFRSLSNIDLDVMPLNVLPEKFQSFPKIITQLEDLEKMNLFNGPILGENF